MPCNIFLLKRPRRCFPFICPFQISVLFFLFSNIKTRHLVTQELRGKQAQRPRSRLALLSRSGFTYFLRFDVLTLFGFKSRKDPVSQQNPKHAVTDPGNPPPPAGRPRASLPGLVGTASRHGFPQKPQLLPSGPLLFPQRRTACRRSAFPRLG